MKKEWIDVEALKNPQKSLKNYGTVGCTKERVGKGKRLIVVDCITENGPVPGALWIFSDSKPRTENQETVEHVETSVEKQRAVENAAIEAQEEENISNQPGSSKTKKRKSKVDQSSSTSKKSKKTIFEKSKATTGRKSKTQRNPPQRKSLVYQRIFFKPIPRCIFKFHPTKFSSPQWENSLIKD